MPAAFMVSSLYRSIMLRKIARGRWRFHMILWAMAALTVWLSLSPYSWQSDTALMFLVAVYWFPISLVVLIALGHEMSRRWLRRPSPTLAGYSLEGGDLTLWSEGGLERRIALSGFTGWRAVKEGPCRVIALVPAALGSTRSGERLRIAPEEYDRFAAELSAFLPLVDDRRLYAVLRGAVALVFVCVFLAVPMLSAFDERPATPFWFVVAILSVIAGAAPLVLWIFVGNPKFHAMEFPPVGVPHHAPKSDGNGAVEQADEADGASRHRPR